MWTENIESRNKYTELWKITNEEWYHITVYTAKLQHSLYNINSDWLIDWLLGWLRFYGILSMQNSSYIMAE